MALARIVFDTVDNFRAPGPHDGIGRLWMRSPGARWPKSILAWQDGRVVQKVSPTDYEIGATPANGQAVPINPDPPDAVFLGGHNYDIDVTSWEYAVLLAAGVTFEGDTPVTPPEGVDLYTDAYLANY